LAHKAMVVCAQTVTERHTSMHTTKYGYSIVAV
jgi:hypothetical protein